MFKRKQNIVGMPLTTTSLFYPTSKHVLSMRNFKEKFKMHNASSIITQTTESGTNYTRLAT